MCDRDTGERIVAAARGMVGAVFRLHGRDPASGIDCVGLALASFRRAGLHLPAPPTYRLRTGPEAPIARWMLSSRFEEAKAPYPGDVVVVAVSAAQTHLMIDAGKTVIHAHAGLGRVVEMPWPAEWRLVSRWRFSLHTEI